MSKKSLEAYNNVDYKQVWIDANGPIPKNWVVHHLDHCKTHNNINNLMAMSRGLHIIYHRIARFLSLQDLFRLADGLMKYVIAEQKKNDKDGNGVV
jgi:hypothetical protein